MGGNLSSNVKPNIIDASQIGISGNNANGNNNNNGTGANGQNQYDSRKSQGAKSLYKENSSRGYWLRFPFSALRFANRSTKSHKSKSIKNGGGTHYGGHNN